jgi:hypothetical protein
MDSTSNITGAPTYIVATGGTETNSPCGDYKIHTFTSDGTFAVTASPIQMFRTNNVDSSIVVAGGAGAGSTSGANSPGGGGAGGFQRDLTQVPISGCYTASPLASGSTSINSYNYNLPNYCRWLVELTGPCGPGSHRWWSR